MRRPCYGFQWVGQPLYSCDNCGHPYWVHTHIETHRKGQRRRVFLKSISREQAEQVRAKWEPEMIADGYTPPVEEP